MKNNISERSIYRYKAHYDGKKGKYSKCKSKIDSYVRSGRLNRLTKKRMYDNLQMY